MTSEIERYKIYLAALLHDIGKFYQRADIAGWKKSRYISSELKKEEFVNSVCPFNEDKFYYEYVHVLWTAEFF